MEPTSRSNRARRWLVGSALTVGAFAGAFGVAGAVSGANRAAPTTVAANQQAPTQQAPNQQAPNQQAPNQQAPNQQAPNQQMPDPATMSHGPGETLLSGTTADKVKAAALAAVPNSTVIRVESDSSGTATYEAHLKKSDGTEVTVAVDSSFKAVSTQNGFGPGPKGDN